MSSIVLTTNDTPSTIFSHFTADEFLASLALDGNIHIVDGNGEYSFPLTVRPTAVWDQPASSAAIVRDGTITNVPAEWTYGDLLIKMTKARVGSTAVQLSVAKVAIYKAHQAECLARASAASAEALQQEADALAAAATDTLHAAQHAEVAGEDSGIDVDSAIKKAADAQSTAENALSHSVANCQDAANALDTAEEAIMKIPAHDRQTFIATLAPEFAHLGGEMEVSEGRPPKPSFSGIPADLFGFVCTGCKVYNLVRSGEKNWYSVFAGKKVGIFYGNNRAMPLVNGVKGASQRGFFTREEAEAAYYAALLANTVHTIPQAIL